MLGDATCRLALQLLGYAWPAYSNYKALEMRDHELVKKWCIYWIILAVFTAVSPFADTFIFWLPFYYEVKLAFPIYLWYNNLAGAEHVYRTYLQPFVAQREPLVDRHLAEAKALAADYCSSGVARLVRLMQIRAFAALMALQSGQAPAQQQQQQHNALEGRRSGSMPASPKHPARGAGQDDEDEGPALDEVIERRTSSFSMERFMSAMSGPIKAFPVNGDKHE